MRLFTSILTVLLLGYPTIAFADRYNTDTASLKGTLIFFVIVALVGGVVVIVKKIIGK